MTITSKTILITGASRGVGRALVDEALERGAKRVYAGTRGAFRHADERVTALKLDVTNDSDIRRAAHEVASLDVLINCAGVAGQDDLTDSDLIQQHLNVNFLGPLRVTQALVPLLKRSRGAIINVLSVAALAPVPVIPAYSISKAAALSMTQAFRTYLAGEGVTVHGVFLGPVDTDMTRGFEIPKVSPEAAARGIFDGFENDEEDIFPDPASRPLMEGWRNGVVKVLEKQNAALLAGASR